MKYKEAQTKAKQALRTVKVRWNSFEHGLLNLGIRQFKREHPYLKGSKIAQFKADEWVTADKWQEGRA